MQEYWVMLVVLLVLYAFIAWKRLHKPPTRSHC